MDAQNLGEALADLANLTYLDQGVATINRQATGGFDQWLTARSNRARHDYLALRNGRLYIPGALTRYRKMLAFATAHGNLMAVAKPSSFVADVKSMAAAIVISIETAGSNALFNPFCPRCGADIILYWICACDFPDDIYMTDGRPAMEHYQSVGWMAP